jgi:subtilase family serine protease
MAMKNTHKNSMQKFLGACGLLAACFINLPVAHAEQSAARIHTEISSAQPAVLNGSLHPMAQPQYDAGRVAADTRLDGITILFNRSPQQEAGLKALIAAQQKPASPLFHQWLTPDQFATSFGMTDADLSKVEAWLQEQGFTVDSVARSKNAIHFSGTARQVEQAFSTEMHNYAINGTHHFAPSTDLSVPAALAPVVLAVKNLDDFKPRAQSRSAANSGVRPNFTSSQTGNVFFDPDDIATVYDIKPLYNEGLTGAGQSITLVGQSAIQTSDIEAFQSAAGITVKDPTQYLVPNSGTSTVHADGDEAESDLDLEWSGAIAPGATINFVYTGSNTSYGAFDSIVYAIDQKIGTIVSSSYGQCETSLSTTTLGAGGKAQPALEAAFEQAASQGQTVLSAAGDDGSTDCFGINGLTTAQQQALAVDYPASSQYVTAMGGTQISQAEAAYEKSDTAYWAAANGEDVISSALKYIPEVVWNDDVSTCTSLDCLSAGGGGASALFSKPSWQTGVPGIPSDGKRDVPDLAMYASPEYPGFLVCSSDSSFYQTGQTNSCVNGFRDSNDTDLTVAGGTSFNGPIFSGILALISQKQGYATGQGLINPILYKLASDSTTYASAFHDITSGNNDCNVSATTICSGAIGFSADTGYDQASGLGSVDVANLAAAWPASTAVAPTLIATTTTITASNATPNLGANDTFTITVAAASGTPTGTVSVSIDGESPIEETLTSNGTFVYTGSLSTAGSHTVFASYGGNSTYAVSTASVSVVASVLSSGNGTIALAATSATLTVASLGSGSQTIKITPSGGYTGTLNLTLTTSNSTALANLCAVWGDENSSGNGVVAVTGTAAANTSLTLDDNASDCTGTGAAQPGGKRPLRVLHPGATAQKNAPGNSAPGSNRNPLPMSVAFAGLLLAGFMGRSSRKLRGLAAILVLAAAGLVVTACGSSVNNTSGTGTGTTTSTNPPAGTYTITVTGTDSSTSSITGSTTFTLTIQ